MPNGIDRIINFLSSYLQDASPEVRESARECFSSLGRDLDRVLKKYLPENLLNVVKEELEKNAKRKSFGRSAESIRTNSISHSQKRSICTRSSSNRLRVSQDIVKEYN